MYRVSVQHHFDAAHYLREYQGKCEHMHGHRFKVRVTLQAAQLDDMGMAFDFTEIKKHLREILERFDHICLNEIEPFDKINPSSENIATTIYNELKHHLKDERVSIYSVDVWESPDSCATYIP